MTQRTIAVLLSLPMLLLGTAACDGGDGGDSEASSASETGADGESGSTADTGETGDSGDSDDAGDTSGDDTGGGSGPDWDAVLEGMADGSGWVVMTKDDSGLVGNVSSVHIDSNNIAWLGTSGFQRWDGDTWDGRDRETSELLTADGVPALSEGPDGRIWVQSISEIVAVNPEDLDDGEAFAVGYQGTPFTGPWFSDGGVVWNPGQRLEEGAATFIGFDAGQEPLAGWPAEVNGTFGIEAGRYLWDYDYDSTEFQNVFYRYDLDEGGLEEFRPEGMMGGLDAAWQADVRDGVVCASNGDGTYVGRNGTWTHHGRDTVPEFPDGDLRAAANVTEDGECVFLSISFVAKTDGDSITVTPLTPPEGLPIGFANGIDVDAQGNIWAAGGNRLLIYVGEY